MGVWRVSLQTFPASIGLNFKVGLFPPKFTFSLCAIISENKFITSYIKFRGTNFKRFFLIYQKFNFD